MKLCFPCFQQHHSAPQTKTEKLQGCQLCAAPTVHFICNCEFPPLHLCQGCSNSHILSSGSIWRHSLESVTTSKAKNLEDQQYVVNMIFKNLQEDLSLIQRAIAEVNSTADAVISRIETWKLSQVTHLREVQERVTTQIALIKSQLESHLADNDYSTGTKLDQVLRTGHKITFSDTIRELGLFRYRFEAGIFEKMMEKLFEFQEDYALSELEKLAGGGGKIEMLHVVLGSNALLKYELPAGYMEVIRISRIRKFLPGTGWSLTTSGALVFTGGSKSGDILRQAVVVNPVAKTAARLKDMTTPRAFHAQVFYSGEIYVFGGTKDVGFWTGKPVGLTSCERYTPSTLCWSDIADLIEPRTNVSSSVHNDMIYLAGSGSSRLEAYSPSRNEVALLPFIIPGSKLDQVLLMEYSGDMLVLKKDRLYRVKLRERSEDVLEVQQYPKPVLDDSNPHPTRLFDTFFIQTKTSAYMLNAQTYSLQIAFKFPAID